MAEYAIQIARSAEKEIENLPANVLQRVTQKIDQLAVTPRPAGCVKLQAARNRWRIRVGNYRIIYAINDAQRLLDVMAVRHRREAYQ
jgi:mRNA interferase RelE/StbE